MIRRLCALLVSPIFAFALFGCAGAGTVGASPPAPQIQSQAQRDAQGAAISSTPPLCGVGSDGNTYYLVYHSSLSRWCVVSDMWNANSAAYTPFFSYGDQVIASLKKDFNYTAQGLPFTFESTPHTGGAGTGTDFGLGDSVTGDAFYNVAYSITGWWGYLFTLHEAINVWVGQIDPGWPDDWWADHRSPFPNSMDYYIMKQIGNQLGSSTIKAAANAQYQRFSVTGTSGYDPEVVMFNGLYGKYGGFSGFANAFALLRADGIAWNGFAANPSPLLSEYLIAYLQLGLNTRADLTQSLFAASGVGTLDTQISPYTLDSNVVRGVADAHCAIKAAAAAGVNVSSALAALRSGNYLGALISGGRRSACPSECWWNASKPQDQCSAPW